MRQLERRFPIYSRILKLYPPAYRQQYGEQMLQTLADMLDHEPSPLRRLRTYLRLAVDVPVTLTSQQVRYAGRAFFDETPVYVRRNTFISFAFFLPFLLIAITNDLAAHGFYHTWLWSFGVLLTWIIVLPSIGLIISLVTFAAWLIDRRKHNRQPWARTLFDFAHNWPMLALSGLGVLILLLVFFHDSAYCVIDNPARAVTHAHQTMHCVENGSILG
ncbi:MAG TPA: hypothetical protein VHC21_02935 [Candidatus Saccharimonadales bacterium]|nr:hypothetical protein [Candidatus Saccharimonadales bacterium]